MVSSCSPCQHLVNPTGPRGSKRQDRDSSPGCCPVHLSSWHVVRRMGMDWKLPFQLLWKYQALAPWKSINYLQPPPSSNSSSSIIIIIIIITGTFWSWGSSVSCPHHLCMPEASWMVPLRLKQSQTKWVNLFIYNGFVDSKWWVQLFTYEGYIMLYHIYLCIYSIYSLYLFYMFYQIYLIYPSVCLPGYSSIYLKIYHIYLVVKLICTKQRTGAVSCRLNLTWRPLGSQLIHCSTKIFPHMSVSFLPVRMYSCIALCMFFFYMHLYTYVYIY